MKRTHLYKTTEIENCGSRRIIKTTVGEITYLIANDSTFVAFAALILSCILSLIICFLGLTSFFTAIQLVDMVNPTKGEFAAAVLAAAFVSLILMFAGFLVLAALAALVAGLVWIGVKLFKWWTGMRRIMRLKIVSLSSTFTLAFGASAIIDNHWAIAYLASFISLLGLGYITAHIWGLDAHPWFLDD